MNTAVYTAIYGPYDLPKPVPDDGDRYVLFTDQTDLDAPGWEVVVDPLEVIPTPMMRAKWWKTHPRYALPDADLSVWIDGSLVPGPKFLRRCVTALDKHDVAFTPHPLRDCIYDELDASIPLPKYPPKRMRDQVAHYRKAGHPEHWGLFATGAITRRHTPNVVTAMYDWWFENVEWSWQDQLSLPFVMRTHRNVSWNTAMPWAEWWGYQEHR